MNDNNQPQPEQTENQKCSLIVVGSQSVVWPCALCSSIQTTKTKFAIHTSQMDKKFYEWTYKGADEKYLGHTFRCPTGTILVDDCEILAKGRGKDRTFYLESVVGSTVHGYFIRNKNGQVEQVKMTRTAGHIMPCPMFLDANKSTITVTEPLVPSQSTPSAVGPTPVSDTSVDISAISATTPLVPSQSTPSAVGPTPLSDGDVDISAISATTPLVPSQSTPSAVGPTPVSDGGVDKSAITATAPLVGAVSESTTAMVPSSQHFTGYKKKLRPRKVQVIQTTPKKTRKRRQLTPEEKAKIAKKRKITMEMKKNYQRGKYAKEDSGSENPKHQQRLLPLSKTEVSSLLKSGSKQYGKLASFIYMVRGWRTNRNTWYYEGKGFNSSRAEFLTTEWLSENHMDKNWRRRTFQKFPSFWFRVPVAYNDGSTQALCIPLAIQKVYNFVGLTKKAEKLSRCMGRYGSSFAWSSQFIYQNRGFTRTSFRLSDFNILIHGALSFVFVIQIAAIQQSPPIIDNTHGICVFAGLIFDANHDQPLKLNQQNLDKCCLGGDQWTFHHVSRAIAFVPAKSVRSYFHSYPVDKDLAATLFS